MLLSASVKLRGLQRATKQEQLVHLFKGLTFSAECFDSDVKKFSPRQIPKTSFKMI